MDDSISRSNDFFSMFNFEEWIFFQNSTHCFPNDFEVSFNSFLGFYISFVKDKISPITEKQKNLLNTLIDVQKPSLILMSIDFDLGIVEVLPEKFVSNSSFFQQINMSL